MMSNRIFETDPDKLRQRLRCCEEEIVRLAKPFDGSFANQDELIDEHLSTRCVILNRLFELHATPAEVLRFEEVNEHLYHLTQELNQRHLRLQEQMSALRLFDGKPFELETTLNYYFDSDHPQLYSMEDDGYYSSRWAEMLWTLADNSRIEIAWCGGGHTCTLDDGISWAEGPLRIPQLEHIIICYAVHALCTHLHYSIPDLLRMTTYCFDYQLNTPSDLISNRI